MEIYIKNEQGQLEETNLMKLLTKALRKANFKLENGSFDGENYNWVGIVQESKKPSEVVTNIGFEDNGNVIVEVNVFETPIKRVVDVDRSTKII